MSTPKSEMQSGAVVREMDPIEQLLRAELIATRAVILSSGQDLAIANDMMDRRLVEFAGKAMTAKLARSREKGRGGWWDPAAVSIDALRQMLVEHVGKGDMRDVMNLAAMVWAREIAD